MHQSRTRPSRHLPLLVSLAGLLPTLAMLGALAPSSRWGAGERIFLALAVCAWIAVDLRPFLMKRDRVDELLSHSAAFATATLVGSLVLGTGGIAGILAAVATVLIVKGVLSAFLLGGRVRRTGAIARRVPVARSAR